MTDFRERLVVLSRDNEATRNFAAFLSEQTSADGQTRVPLRLPVNVFNDRRALTERRVSATLVPLRPIDDESPAYAIAWASQTMPAFPELSGTLMIEKSPVDDRLVIIVTGHAAPPVQHVPGDAVDAVLNGRIAQAAARDLLRAIAEFIENAAAHNAAARAGHYRRHPATTAAG